MTGSAGTGFFGAELSDCDLTGFGGDGVSISGTWTRCQLSAVYLPSVQSGGSWVLVESHGERVGLPGASLDSVEILECRLSALQVDLTGAKLDPGALDSLGSARNVVDPRGNPR